MQDPEPQEAAGKVQWAFMMSLDGFVAGPGHTMDFMERATTRGGLLEEYIAVTGAVLAGRDGYDSAVGVNPYGGAWKGPIFVLTHHPEDAREKEGVTFLDCSVEEAVRIGLEAADGKNLQVHSPTIGKQLLRLDLIDEIDIRIAPVLLGDGVCMTLLAARSSTSSVTVTNPPSLQTSATDLFGGTTPSQARLKFRHLIHPATLVRPQRAKQHPHLAPLCVKTPLALAF